MAKRQTRKDRMHESVGETMYHRMHHPKYGSDGKAEARLNEEAHDMEERSNHRNKMTNPHLGPEYYAGMDPRRRQEMRDAGMIHEDHRAIANLPQQVIMHEWPKNPAYQDYNLDDTIKGIDVQEHDDATHKIIKRGPYPTKY